MSGQMKCAVCGHTDDWQEFQCVCCNTEGNHDCGAECLDCKGTGYLCPECKGTNIEDVDEEDDQ